MTTTAQRPAAPAAAARARRPVKGIFGRYTAGSVIAAVVTEAVLLLGYGPIGLNARVASVAAWVAGAGVNYMLNRRWAWGRTERANPWRETIPYWLIAVGSMVVSAWATGVADQVGTRLLDGDWARTAFVGAAFLAVYGLLFVGKFLIFHYVLFADAGAAGRRRSRHQVPSTTRE